MSHFFFYHNVFKSRLLQRHQKAYVCGKGLMVCLFQQLTYFGDVFILHAIFNLIFVVSSTKHYCQYLLFVQLFLTLFNIDIFIKRHFSILFSKLSNTLCEEGPTLSDVKPGIKQRLFPSPFHHDANSKYESCGIIYVITFILLNILRHVQRAYD